MEVNYMINVEKMTNEEFAELLRQEAGESASREEFASRIFGHVGRNPDITAAAIYNHTGQVTDFRTLVRIHAITVRTPNPSGDEIITINI